MCSTANRKDGVWWRSKRLNTGQERRRRVRWAGTHPVGGGTRRWDSSPRSPLSVASPKRQSQRDCSKSQAARRHSTTHLCGNRASTRAHLSACVCVFVCVCVHVSILHIHTETGGRQSTRRVHHLRNCTRATRSATRPPHNCDQTSPRESRQSMINHDRASTFVACAETNVDPVTGRQRSPSLVIRAFRVTAVKFHVCRLERCDLCGPKSRNERLVIFFTRKVYDE